MLSHRRSIYCCALYHERQKASVLTGDSSFVKYLTQQEAAACSMLMVNDGSNLASRHVAVSRLILCLHVQMAAADCCVDSQPSAATCKEMGLRCPGMAALSANSASQQWVCACMHSCRS